MVWVAYCGTDSMQDWRTNFWLRLVPLPGGAGNPDGKEMVHEGFLTHFEALHVSSHMQQPFKHDSAESQDSSGLTVVNISGAACGNSGECCAFGRQSLTPGWVIQALLDCL